MRPVSIFVSFIVIFSASLPSYAKIEVKRCQKASCHYKTNFKATDHQLRANPFNRMELEAYKKEVTEEARQVLFKICSQQKFFMGKRKGQVECFNQRKQQIVAGYRSVVTQYQKLCIAVTQVDCISGNSLTGKSKDKNSFMF